MYVDIQCFLYYCYHKTYNMLSHVNVQRYYSTGFSNISIVVYVTHGYGPRMRLETSRITLLSNLKTVNVNNNTTVYNWTKQKVENLSKPVAPVTTRP